MLSILNNYSILYVEDDAQTRKNMSEYLESFFSMVYFASDGKEGLLLYEQYHPSVLLLDVNLPILDGLMLAKHIRKIDTSVKIIMLTGVSDTSKLLLATELHLTKYLLKPVTPKQFEQALEELALELQKCSSDFIFLSNKFVWNTKNEKLLIEEKNISLSFKEHSLLKLLIKYRGKCVYYERIMLALWEDSFNTDISIGSVKNQVSLLRKKLPKGSIDSVYGKGYILR